MPTSTLLNHLSIIVCCEEQATDLAITVYTIAQLKFTDLEAYRRYQRAFPVVLAKFEARLLVADEGPTVIEGDWSRDKVVIIEFPDHAEAMRFRDDPDYRAIAKDRKAGADAIVLMVKGVDVPPAWHKAPLTLRSRGWP